MLRRAPLRPRPRSPRQASRKRPRAARASRAAPTPGRRSSNSTRARAAAVALPPTTGSRGWPRAAPRCASCPSRCTSITGTALAGPTASRSIASPSASKRSPRAAAAASSIRRKSRSAAANCATGRDANAFGRRIVETAAEPARVRIALSAVRRADALDVALSVTPRAGAPRALDAYLALYENGVESQVRAGENRGATLRHERVVRQWIGPLAATGDAGAPLDARRALPLPANLRAADAARYGVAAFVEDRATGDVLQALDLPLCG
ncbi:conserved hypothetical protein, frameshift [Burkholderia thailandensis E264]|uniref:Uncharacterized protein n=1 Tax=Burkholderia thailandensis (strain ATCC 700388 / DSM 13276 / CCUG 48851 / CIP 106301 / E264) TaxID=271848 RepID=Q2SUP5_BURTA|nr:conserved hypothetical protein, frameshift [Burkholderia thailandensis E264]